MRLRENVPAGSLINENNVCEMTSPHVQRLIDAGANLFARQQSPSLHGYYNAITDVGITHNPWKMVFRRFFGGLSGCFSAGATTIATGSDSTGSIRQPASHVELLAINHPMAAYPILVRVLIYKSGPMTRQ